MKIIYTKLFLKHYKKRIKPYPKLRNRFQGRVKLFDADKRQPILYDHKLKGKIRSIRSFSITGNIRVIYHKEGEDMVVFLDVGTHSQVYGT